MATPFDGSARAYDQDFSGTRIGTLLRSVVWRRLDEVFPRTGRVLDLGCGTGEDAVRLAAGGRDVVGVDGSSEMVRVARAKAAARGVGDRVVVHHLPFERLDALPDGGPFDAVLSNFGALNCVADLSALARTVARRVAPGAPLALCVMGPTVPWEWIWFLARGRPGTAFRRLRPGGVDWRGVRVRYPTPGAVARAFAPFRVTGVRALGALIPPPYTEAWARRHPRFLDALSRWERRMERVPPLPWLADHFLIEMVAR